MGRGLPPKEAVAKTGGTAGRTVFFSGATVVLALVGLLIVPASFYQSLALGAILVVLASLAATLTLLPAVLSLLGPRVDLLSIPFLARFSLKSPEATEHGFWETITRRRNAIPHRQHPGYRRSADCVLTVFYFGIRTGLNDVNTFPDSREDQGGVHRPRRGVLRRRGQPRGGPQPRRDSNRRRHADDPQVREAIARLEQSILDSPDFPVPPLREVNDDGDLTLLTLPFPGKSNSRAATERLNRLRDTHIPAAFGGVPAEVYVGGVTAEATDFYGIVDVYTPIVFAFVLGLSFIILMLVFRSIVIPIKAIIMNLLSVGATYGLLVLVFQKGVATDLLGFQHAEVIDAWIPPVPVHHPLRALHGLPCIPDQPHPRAVRRDRGTTPARWPTACGPREG